MSFSTCLAVRGIHGSSDSRACRRVALLTAFVVLVAFLFIVAMPVRALAADANDGENGPHPAEAQAWEIIDQDGNVLSSHNAQAQMPMASITKIMTAMVALDSGISLDTPVTIPDGLSFQADAQLCGFKPGETPTLRDLIMGMLVYSGNDAASYIAIAVAGSEDAFAELMNAKAAQLGMTNTHFVNPHGLEADGHYSCAHDLAIMGRYALENYPLIAQAVTTHSVTLTVGGQPKTFQSTDDLMGSYAGLCGIKTGAVESGTTFLGSSRRHGIQTFSCVLGCKTHEGRFSDTAILMDWVYDSYMKGVTFTRKSWPIRLSTYSLGFWGKVVTTSQSDARGRYLPGSRITYSCTLAKSTLADANGPTGYASWYQNGRPLAYATYSTGRVITNVSSFNVFALPLFYDMTELTAA